MDDALQVLYERWKEQPTPELTRAMCEALGSQDDLEHIGTVGAFVRSQLPNDADALVAAGKMFLRVGLLAEAFNVLLLAGKVAPQRASVYRWLGETLLRRGDAERAVKVLDRAVELGGGDADIAAWRDKAEKLIAVQLAQGTSAVADEVASAPPTRMKPPRPPPAVHDDAETLARQMSPEFRSAWDAQRARRAHAAYADLETAQTTPLSDSERLPASVSAPAIAATMETHLDTQIARPARLVPEDAPPRSVTSGAKPNLPDPRDVLDALALAGVFEPPQAGSTESLWQKPERVRGRKRPFVFLSVLVALAVGGGVGGFRYVAQKRAADQGVAQTMLDQIEADLRLATPASIPVIEEKLGKAFELHSLSPRAALLWARERALVGLIVSTQGIAFEDAILRAKEVGVAEEQVAFGHVAGFLFQGDTASAALAIAKWDGSAQRDAWFQLVAGATLERAGDARAASRYAAAVSLDPELWVAEVALVRALICTGDPKAEAALASLQKKHPERIETLALSVLSRAHGEDRGARGSAEPLRARFAELPLRLRFVPSLVSARESVFAGDAVRALGFLKEGLPFADLPEVATWFGELAVLAGDEEFARRAALVAVGYSAVYAPARALAGQVALLGGRLDEATKAVEELDAAEPAVAIVRAASAYERLDVDGIARALAAPTSEAKNGPALIETAKSASVLVASAPAKLAVVEGALWSEFVAVDAALDLGNLDEATRLMATWSPDDTRPARAVRLARKARYEGKLDAADAASARALAAHPTPRAILERALVSLAAGKPGDVAPLLARYPSVAGPLAPWLSALASAALGKHDDARAKLAMIEPPPSGAPVPLRTVAALALAGVRDRRRGSEVLSSLGSAGLRNPDVRKAAQDLGTRLGRR